MYSKSQDVRWAVVGGGFLGMTLALRLAQSGKAVSLFEGAPQLGGLAGAWKIGDIVWDRHYHVILQSDAFLLGLLAEIGLKQDVRWVSTRTGFYTDGKLYSLSNSLEFLRFPPLGFIDKARLAATILYAARIKEWNQLESILVSDWLGRWSGKRVLKKIWLPLLRAKLGESYRETSAAFIWATIARMYAARRAGMKKEVFGYVPGGYARVLERLASRLNRENIHCRLGVSVRQIDAAGKGAVVELENGSTQTFDQVVVTMAAPVAARVCRGLTAAEKEQLSAIKYQGIICASLLLQQPLSNFYITNITDDRLPYTAVIEMSAMVDRNQFGGRSLVYLPRYLSSDSPDFKLTDAEIQARFLDGLRRMYPDFKPEHVQAFQVSRVKYLLPIPTLNYSKKLPPLSTSIPSIHILNSAHIVNGTLNVNETIQLAERAATHFAALPGPHAFKDEKESPHCQPVA